MTDQNKSPPPFYSLFSMTTITDNKSSPPRDLLFIILTLTDHNKSSPPIDSLFTMTTITPLRITNLLLLLIYFSWWRSWRLTFFHLLFGSSGRFQSLIPAVDEEDATHGGDRGRIGKALTTHHSRSSHKLDANPVLIESGRGINS